MLLNRDPVQMLTITFSKIAELCIDLHFFIVHYNIKNTIKINAVETFKVN